MGKAKIEAVCVRILLTTVATVTLVVTPYLSTDPINLPKLLLLVIGAFGMMALVFTNYRKFDFKVYRTSGSVLLLFVLDLFLVLLNTPGNKFEQFFGITGRNTGTLAYLSLSIIMFTSILVSNQRFLHLFSYQAIFIGSTLVIYGWLQSTGKEFFPYISSYANPVIGTFGNPDFQSAFVGIIGVLGFGLSLPKSKVFSKQLALVFVPIASIYIIVLTGARQGFLCFVAGSGLVLILFSFSRGWRKISFFLSIIGSIGGLLVFFGLINRGPLADLLFKNSLAARGYYWRAAFQMLKEHPMTGIGLDGFGDSYRGARSLEAALFNPGLASDAAHNVYLDFASSGGIPLVMLYLFIVALVIKSIVRVALRGTRTELPFIAISGAWFAYQVQAFVSINQLGLAIWGWILSGIIIGYEINTRSTSGIPKESISRKPKQMTAKPVVLIPLFCGSIIGGLLAAPPFLASIRYYEALKSSDVRIIDFAAKAWPPDRFRLLQSASIFEANKFGPQAKILTVKATEQFPDCFEAWRLLSQLSSATPAQIVQAKSEMKRLDPYNPDLK